MQMMLTGAAIDAREAHRVGLVNQCVPAEQLMPVAHAIAERIAAKAPIAVRQIKQVALSASGLPLAQAYALEDAARKQVLATDGPKEGPRAFIEKRAPRDQGR